MQKKSAAELSELINDHIAHLQMIGATWSGDILRQLKDAQKELLEYFLNTQKHFGAIGIDAGTNKKFELIQERIEKLLNQAYGQAMEGIRENSVSLAENDAKWAGSFTRAVSGHTVSQVGKRTLNNIAKYGRYNGLNLAEMFNSMAVSDADRIFKTVSHAIKTGATPGSLKKSVQKAFDISNDQAYAMGLTCANGIANDAKLALYSENSDVVKEIEILNTLDGRTCLARGQLIQTPNGEKPIETVKTGDFVIGGSRNRRRVLGTSTKKVKQIVVVTLSNGEKIRCTADHLFLTENKEWKDAGKLRIGERLAESL